MYFQYILWKHVAPYEGYSRVGVNTSDWLNLWRTGLDGCQSHHERDAGGVLRSFNWNSGLRKERLFALECPYLIFKHICWLPPKGVIADTLENLTFINNLDCSFRWSTVMRKPWTWWGTPPTASQQAFFANPAVMRKLYYEVRIQTSFHLAMILFLLIEYTPGTFLISI